ncbi:hypothetical protein ALQ20_05410 [Pseudomonas syringae pv. atrofaciens]|nr:hypothetical protein ALQ20_05410 [Pseudomonas syringae pv. atrofaciens]
MQGKARRKLLLQLTESLAQGITERLHIEAWLHRNRQYHSILSLVDRFGFRRVERAHRHPAQVLQRDLLTIGQLHRELPKLLQRKHLATDRKRGALLANDRVASCRYQVAGLQLLKQLLRGKSGGGQRLVLDIEVDALILQAIQLDLIDALERIKLIAQAFDRTAYLAHGETRCGQRDRSHDHATEIIIDKRPLGARRKTTARFAHLRPEPLPQQPKILDVVIRCDLHDHSARLDRSEHVLDLGQFTDTLFERPGEQFLAALCGQPVQRHADQCVANSHRRLFLRRKAQKSRDTGQQNQQGSKQGQAACAHGAGGKIHCASPVRRVSE